MVTELAAAKACDLLRSRWTGIRSPVEQSVSGTLRIETCEASRDGESWRFVIGTSGWQLRDATRALAPGAYAVRGYERFDATVSLHGPLDITYDPATRTASLRFSTDRPIGVRIIPSRGAPSGAVASPDLNDSIVSTIAGALVGSRLPQNLLPEPSTPLTISATASLCLGTWSFSVDGRAAAADDQAEVPIELGRDGIAMIGPFPAGRPVNIMLDAQQGVPRVDLICEADATKISEAFAQEEQVPRVKPLISRLVHGQASVGVSWPRCAVVMVARSTGGGVERVTWARSAEDARVVHEPAVPCASGPEPTMKSPP